MCERGMEQQRQKVKDLSEFEPFSIKIEVKGIDLEVIVNASDPCDCVVLAGAITAHLRKIGKEPKVVILP